GIAPARVAALAFIPVIGDARAAEEADLAVYDDQLAVRAVVDARQRVPLDGVIPTDAPAGVEQFLIEALPGGKAADSVEHEIDVHTRARTVGQRRDEAAGDLALLKNVSFEIDAMLRLPYSIEFS